ncbi:MAG: YidH family protein [Sandaracinobacter sp.]
MALETLDTGTRMASVRTSAAFQRTRMAADRTLMAGIRTSLSMIGFGFTIFSFFRTLVRDGLLRPGALENAPALFGLSLVSLGILTLSMALIGEWKFNQSLRGQRQVFIDAGELRADEQFPRSWVWLIGFLLLLVGLFAVGNMALSLAANPL